MLVIPVFSFAQFQGPCPEGTYNNGTACVPTQSGGLVPCNNTPDDKGHIANPCDFNQLMNLVNKVIHFILFDMVIPIAAIMFAYAGFELVTSGGSTEKRGIAKKVFFNALLGFIIAIAAFLIIRTILSILGYSGSWLGFDPISIGL